MISGSCFQLPRHYFDVLVPQTKRTRARLFAHVKRSLTVKCPVIFSTRNKGRKKAQSSKSLHSPHFVPVDAPNPLPASLGRPKS